MNRVENVDVTKKHMSAVIWHASFLRRSYTWTTWRKPTHIPKAGPQANNRYPHMRLTR